MCGASEEEKQLGHEETDFFRQMKTEAGTEFAGFNNIISSLSSHWQAILDKGINQAGFDPTERAALNTTATEGVAKNFQKGKEALANRLAASGGGSAFLPSGAQAELNAGLEVAAQGESSELQEKILEEDYALGRSNYLQASSALGNIAGLEDPAHVAGAVDESGKVASDTWQAIDAANNAWMAPVFGAIGGVGAALAGRGGHH